MPQHKADELGAVKMGRTIYQPDKIMIIPFVPILGYTLNRYGFRGSEIGSAGPICLFRYNTLISLQPTPII
ncbi:MAG TPA: hypothetical protein VK112_06195 [Fodinibius sp.]|nr:hypothetical protein [Fodinibius sp.]